MKAKSLLIVLPVLIIQSAMAAPDSTWQSLQSRIVALEGDQSLRDAKNDVAIAQLRVDFEAMRQQADANGMTIWIAIAAGLGFLGVSAFVILKFAKNHAQNLVQAKLDKDLPPMVQQRMEQSFEKLLRERSSVILELIGAHDRVEGYKRSKSILIVCDDDAYCKKMQALIGMEGFGFENVKTMVAGPELDPKAHDLVLFAREKAGANAGENLTDAYMVDFSERLPEGGAFVYYGPHVQRFNSLPREVVHFANIVFTVFTRIVEVFEYQEAVK